MSSRRKSARISGYHRSSKHLSGHRRESERDDKARQPCVLNNFLSTLDRCPLAHPQGTSLSGDSGNVGPHFFELNQTFLCGARSLPSRHRNAAVDKVNKLLLYGRDLSRTGLQVQALRGRQHFHNYCTFRPDPLVHRDPTNAVEQHRPSTVDVGPLVWFAARELLKRGRALATEEHTSSRELTVGRKRDNAEIHKLQF